MKKISYLIVGALALMACTPNAEPVNNSDNVVVSPVPSTPVASNDCGLTRGTLKDEQALFAAETAYNIPADAYVNLGDKLPAATKAQVKYLLIKSYDFLLLARKAYTAGDGCDLKNYTDLAQALGNKAKTYLPAK